MDCMASHVLAQWPSSKLTLTGRLTLSYLSSDIKIYQFYCCSCHLLWHCWTSCHHLIPSCRSLISWCRGYICASIRLGWMDQEVTCLKTSRLLLSSLSPSSELQFHSHVNNSGMFPVLFSYHILTPYGVIYKLRIIKLVWTANPKKYVLLLMFVLTV